MSHCVYIFGTGTTLIILGGPHYPPKMNVYPPSQEEKESKNKATIVCLVHGFSPASATVAWQANGNTITNGVETTKPTKVNDKYMMSSYLTVDPSEWESKSFSCKVTHEGTDYVESVSHSQCP